MKLWNATLAATLSVLLFGAALAQNRALTPPPLVAQIKAEAPKLLPLTAEEKLAIRSAQVRLMKADEALHATPQQAALSAAQASLQQTIDAVYAVRKITTKDAVPCDGPGTPGCEKAPAGELSLRPVAREEKK